MIIGIDGNEANIKNRVGVNRYAFEVLKNLHKLQGEWEKEHKLIVYLKDQPLSDMPKETQNFRYKILKGSSLWLLTKLMPYLFRNPEKLDVLFSPSHYTVPFAPIPRVCAIMDLGYLEFSSQFTKKVFWQLKVWSAISIFVSKRIISISNSTAKDIVRHYPFAGNKIRVTHLGHDKTKFNLNIGSEDVRRIRKRYSIVDDYVLYLGTLKPSKNVGGLIEAFVILSKLKPYNWKLGQLVIAGPKGWMYGSIFKKVEESGISDKVVFTDYIKERDKAPLIKGAKVFVLPSFWEGFGLDVLSAMAVGTPVVASRAGSLPEVVGNAGILVDPNSPESIAAGIKEVLSMNNKRYNRIVQAGLLQAGEFSWEKCARQTLEAITGINN